MGGGRERGWRGRDGRKEGLKEVGRVDAATGEEFPPPPPPQLCVCMCLFVCVCVCVCACVCLCYLYRIYTNYILFSPQPCLNYLRHNCLRHNVRPHVLKENVKCEKCVYVVISN